MKRLFRRQRALVKLIYEVQNETASSAQLRELADRLRHDPEAQKLYVFLMDMHAELILDEEFPTLAEPDLLAPLPEPETPRPRPRRTLKPISHYLLLTVCYLLPFTVMAYFGYYALQPVPQTQVATLQEMEQGRLISSSEILAEKSPLLTGQRYRLQEGVARLQMNSGATVILESPADFELLHHNGIRLHRGALAAEIVASAVGFVVETSTQRVVDLGTRFGVRVEESGASETHVFHGKVVCAETQTEQSDLPPHLLSAGEGIQMPGDGSAAISLTSDENRFSRALQFQARIVSLSGSLEYRQEMPERLGAGDFTSDSNLSLFLEQKNLALPEDVTVWKIPVIGSGDNPREERTVIPRGTRVNVFLLHLDGPHQDAAGNDHPRVALSGSVRFHQSVLGAIKPEKELYATDKLLGRKDVAYDNIEFGQSGRCIDRSDKVELSPDGTELSVAWSLRGGGGIGRDQIRILVEAEE
jgi:ferric-dicitrate binding protein FerR (iron transport regulator)